MKTKYVILDDDSLSIRALKKHLECFEHFELVYSCDNAIDTFEFVNNNPVDLIFVDINMPMVNGIDFIRSLQTPPLIIIVSSDHQYAVEGFELGVVDYLIKPISLKRLMKSLHKVSRLLSRANKLGNELQPKLENHIFVKVDKKMIKIFFKDILYIESLKDYVIIKTNRTNYVTHYNLSAITRLLPDDLFMRIHRSYTIAVSKIKAIDKNFIEIDDKLLPMGRNYMKEVKGKIMKGAMASV